MARSCFDKLSTNGKTPVISIPRPFVLSPSKDEKGFCSSRVRGKPILLPRLDEGSLATSAGVVWNDEGLSIDNVMNN